LAWSIRWTGSPNPNQAGGVFPASTEVDLVQPAVAAGSAESVPWWFVLAFASLPSLSYCLPFAILGFCPNHANHIFWRSDIKLDITRLNPPKFSASRCPYRSAISTSASLNRIWRAQAWRWVATVAVATVLYLTQ
jgi:hypothetical protein